MNYAENVLGTLKQSPLVKLQKIVEELAPLVLLKNEAINPSNSIKDRIANYILKKAEVDGELKKGGTIIEATSANLAIALATAAVVKGYNMIAVMTDKQSQEKIAILKALGSEIIICPTEISINDARSQYSVAKRIHQRTPNSWLVPHYSSLNNLQAHYQTTGPEIWEQTKGKVTHVVVPVTTGGTISGIAKYLKEQNSNIKVWGVDIYGSVLKKYADTQILDANEIYPYETEEVGANIISEIIDFNIIDGFVKVTDKNSALLTKELARKEGLLLGNSAGAVIGATKQLKGSFTTNDVVVLVINDHGAHYLSKVYNEEWMSKRGFLDMPAKIASDLVKDPTADVITVKTSELVSHAVARMRKYKISQIPVVDTNGFVGSVDEMSLFSAYLDDHRKNDTPIKEIMNASFPMVNSFTSVEEIANLIRKGHSAVLVALDNEKHGIITKSDVISHIQ